MDTPGFRGIVVQGLRVRVKAPTSWVLGSLGLGGVVQVLGKLLSLGGWTLRAKCPGLSEVIKLPAGDCMMTA